MERRRHKRVPLGVPVQCQSDRMEVEGRAENVSVSGLLIRLLVRVSKTFPEGEEIVVSFEIPGSPLAVRSRARVAHVVPDAFMGVEFLALSPELEGLVEQYVAAQSVPEARTE